MRKTEAWAGAARLHIYNRKAVAFARQLLIRKTSESVPVEESQVQSFKYHLILVRILDFYANSQ